MISVKIKTQDGWRSVWFLVDSGADTTVIPASLATAFGIPYDKQNSTDLEGVGASQINAYPGTVNIKFGKKIVTARTYFLDSNLSTMLLGRMDVFDEFTVKFDKDIQAIVFSS